MEYFLLWLAGACGFAFIGRSVGRPKNAEIQGWFLGFLLGPVGVVVTAMLDRRPNCPHCGDQINGHPAICKSCKSRFEWDGNQCTYFPPA
jgi:hypothetical protein